MAIGESVVDHYGACGIAVALQVFVNVVSHLPVRLISSHMTKDGGADGAFGPLLLPDHGQQTGFVVLMRAAEHEDVLIVLSRELQFYVFDLKLFQADHALLFFHFGLGQFELNGGVVVNFEDVVVLFLLQHVLFVDQVYHQGHHLVVLVVSVYRVGAVEVHLPLLVRDRLHEKLVQLARLHSKEISNKNYYIERQPQIKTPRKAPHQL